MKPPKALFFILFTILLWGCNVNNNDNHGGLSYYDRATYYYNLNKLDSAFHMFTEYVNHADDSLKKGTAYRCMGDMQWEVGDLHAAEENATGTIRTLDPRNTAHHAELSYAYNLLGNIHVDLRHYDEAIAMYHQAKRFSTDSTFIANLVNGEALALQKKGNYAEAIALYDSVLWRNTSDKALFARLFDNRAKTKWLQDNSYPVLPEFWYALKIRTDSQYNRGLNASYAHLADYYATLNRDSALWYAKRMFYQAQIMQSPDDRLEAIDKLIRLDKYLALPGWYTEFKRLNDSTRFSRDTTRNRYALIRYDAQKSKADNLELKAHVIKQRVWMSVLIILSIGIITGLFTWYNKRRKRIKQESENAIRDSKLKTSQKVHDVVANGLYGIMNELEHGDKIERDPLLTRIEELYEKSRDISSYEEVYADDTNYDKHIHELLDEFTNRQTNVFAIGNQPAFWSKVTSVQKKQLLLILREIMTNMKKHSGAKNVVIRFKQENYVGTIHYSDDGKGFSSDLIFGNGLNSTVNRTKALHGKIIFGRSEKGGASIEINIPLQSIHI